MPFPVACAIRNIATQYFSNSKSLCKMSPTLSSVTAPSQASQSKRYPYVRPRRATTRPTPKAALYGALQPKKRGNNFSLGSRQIPRIVSTSKPDAKVIDPSPESCPPLSSAIDIDIDSAPESTTQQETAYVPLKLPRLNIPPVDPKSFCFGRLSDVVSLANAMAAPDSTLIPWSFLQPPEYVISHVKLMSPHMLKAATMYRPTPPAVKVNGSLGSASSTQGKVLDISLTDTIRFDIPADLYSNQKSTVDQLGGLEPTHCLAVRPRPRVNRDERAGGESDLDSTILGEREAVGRMIPIQ